MSENETVTLFIDESKEHQFHPDTKIREVLLLVLDGDDGHLFLEGAEEPLLLEITLREAGIGHEGTHHVHAARCRHIEVTVEYAGAEHSHEFSPAARVKTVRDWAVAQKWPQPIDPAEKPKFGLFLPEHKDPLVETRHIGMFVHRGECRIVFELALRERPQG